MICILSSWQSLGVTKCNYLLKNFTSGRENTMNIHLWEWAKQKRNSSQKHHLQKIYPNSGHGCAFLIEGIWTQNETAPDIFQLFFLWGLWGRKNMEKHRTTLRN